MKLKSIAPLLLFCLWSFFAFILSVVYFKNKKTRYLIPLFFALIGFTFQQRGDSDALRSIEHFEMVKDYSFIDLLNYFIRQFSGLEDGGIELYKTILAYTASIFTTDWRLMMALGGLFLGFIVLKFFENIYEKYQKAPKGLVIHALLIFLMLYMPPVWVINGRFWLAYWIFIFSFYKYITTLDFKFIFLGFTAVFVHQGIALSIIILLLFATTRNLKQRNLLYYSLIILSLIISNIGIEFIVKIGESLGGSFDKKIQEYAVTGLETSNNITDAVEAAWFIKLRNVLLYYSLISSILILRFDKRIKFDALAENVYSFILLFMAFQVFFNDVPSLGGRYKLILLGLILLLLFLLATINQLKLYSAAVIIAFIGLFFNLVIALRIEFDQLYGFIFITNPFFAIFKDDVGSVWELISN